MVLNMWSLWIFGDNIEDQLGSIKFLVFYFLCGLVAALTHSVLNPMSEVPVVGASGAVWSLMAMYALYYPERVFNIYFVIPAKIKYIVGIYFIIEVILALSSNDGVSHIAHIGGALTGFIVYLSDIRGFQSIK